MHTVFLLRLCVHRSGLQGSLSKDNERELTPLLNKLPQSPCSLKNICQIFNKISTNKMSITYLYVNVASLIMKRFQICIVQYCSNQPHVATYYKGKFLEIKHTEKFISSVALATFRYSVATCGTCSGQHSIEHFHHHRKSYWCTVLDIQNVINNYLYSYTVFAYVIFTHASL